MSSWNESLKFQILKEDTSDAEIEFETGSEKSVYIYVKPININVDSDEGKREFIGSVSLETFMAICNRAKQLWEEEAKTEVT
jgi:hypothetical protein